MKYQKEERKKENFWTSKLNIFKSGNNENHKIKMRPFLKRNDDRIRDLNINNTEFNTADKMVEYELDGIESVNMSLWRNISLKCYHFTRR